VRYALSPYIKQIRFVLKGLMNIRIIYLACVALAKCIAVLFYCKLTHEGFNGLDVFLLLVLHYLQ
jgi:hypothetical protein